MIRVGKFIYEYYRIYLFLIISLGASFTQVKFRRTAKTSGTIDKTIELTSIVFLNIGIQLLLSRKILDFTINNFEHPHRMACIICGIVSIFIGFLLPILSEYTVDFLIYIYSKDIVKSNIVGILVFFGGW